jgi:hypothetical protein
VAALFKFLERRRAARERKTQIDGTMFLGEDRKT